MKGGQVVLPFFCLTSAVLDIDGGADYNYEKN